jgi:hypothetical protein
LEPGPIGETVEARAARYLVSCQEFGDIYAGIPVGHPEYIKCFVEECLKELAKDFKHLETYEDDPQQYHLFLSMVLPGKITHLLRGIAPEYSKRLTDGFTAMQRAAICDMAKVTSITDLQFDLARMGTGSGGAGYRNVEIMREPAFVAGYLAGLDFAVSGAPDLVDRLVESDRSRQTTTGYATADHFLQAVWTLQREEPSITLEALLQIDEAGLKKLQKKLTGHRKEAMRKRTETAMSRDWVGFAHHEAGTQREAGMWLTAIPRTPGTTIPPLIFQQAIRNRCLIPHPNIDTAELPCSICPMKSYTGKMDVRGVHAQKCKAMQHLAINTHDMVKDELITMLKQCGVSTRAEPNDVLLLAGLGDRGKPDFVTRTMGGGRTAYDLRVTNAVTIDVERGKRKSEPREAMNAAEHAKNTNYKERCRVNGLDFKALVINSQGNYSKTLDSFITHTISDYSKRTKTPEEAVRRYYDMRISVALQVGVAIAGLTRAELIRCRKETGARGPEERGEDLKALIREGVSARVSSAPTGGGAGRQGIGVGGSCNRGDEGGGAGGATSWASSRSGGGAGGAAATSNLRGDGARSGTRGSTRGGTRDGARDGARGGGLVH